MAYIKDPKERLFNERFVLQNPIGKGGYSKVYKAHCIRNAKTVAVKRVKRSMVESYDLVEDEFIPTELNILRKLQKIKYVIKIQECIESDNFVYFILEKPTNYIDLFWYVDSCFRLREWIAKKIFKNLVVAVKLIHDQKIIHRDIKDTNVLVNPDTNAVKIIDFGLSSHFTARHETSFVGTKAFAPAEWHEKKSYQPLKAESFALGWTLFVMLEGDDPFTCRQNLLNGQIEFSNIGTSNPCKDLLKSLLSPNPEKRPLPIDILRSTWLRH